MRPLLFSLQSLWFARLGGSCPRNPFKERLAGSRQAQERRHLQKFEQESSRVSEALGITFEQIGRAGVVTLSRPTRLNALNQEMFEALSEHYRRWAPAPQIYGVFMQSSHPTVFSSGGDLKVLHESLEQGALR